MDLVGALESAAVQMRHARSADDRDADAEALAAELLSLCEQVRGGRPGIPARRTLGPSWGGVTLQVSLAVECRTEPFTHAL